MLKSIATASLAIVLLAGSAFAADVKSYQVTGPVLEVTDKVITVQKGSDKWQIAKGTASVPADVKVGSKVTVTYVMTASSIVSKSK